MLNFIIRRIAQIPLVMLVLSVLVIGLTQLLTPEQRAAPYIRSDQAAARMEQIINERGLRDPFPVQYARWFSNTIKGDLGYSKASGKDVVDTIKVVDSESYVINTPDRTSLRAIQTPQGFTREVITRAHAAGKDATDDAALVAELGVRVKVIKGDPLARKITTLDDLAWAKELVGHS